MFHACVERFDVMDRRENILGWDGEMNKALEAVMDPAPEFLCHYSTSSSSRLNLTMVSCCNNISLLLR
jgi:hypothetical protein